MSRLFKDGSGERNGGGGDEKNTIQGQQIQDSNLLLGNYYCRSPRPTIESIHYTPKCKWEEPTSVGCGRIRPWRLQRN